MSYPRIVVATDFSEASLVALETGFNLALEGTETIYVLHVIEPAEIVAHEQAKHRLDRLVPEGWEQNQVRTIVLTGAAPAKAIAQFASDRNVDLIVVGTHGRRGLTRMLMGSTAESLLRHSPCQVLVVKQKATVEATKP